MERAFPFTKDNALPVPSKAEGKRMFFQRRSSRSAQPGQAAKPCPVLQRVRRLARLAQGSPGGCLVLPTPVSPRQQLAVNDRTSQAGF